MRIGAPDGGIKEQSSIEFGARFETMASRACPACGATVLPDANACPACSVRLGSAETESTQSTPFVALDTPSHIGPYKILERLGEGGMGVVYLAEQERPFRRRVALKVIKVGMDTREVIARFEAERQALALMDHPHIARIYDAGAHTDGRPFFAMEYVAGIPITEYCDKHRLSTEARLALFVELCEAIQHAHQRGIIHRDIKPSNVLVMVHDGRPHPKVIDFGVAKAIHQRLTEKTVFTRFGLLIGTPAYMSPEQAEMSGLDVDATTDIYSLGVLLYELLVGALPFDANMLRSAGYAEIQRIIREEEPVRPSARLSSPDAAGRAIAEQRHTDLAALQREVKGDLDWITLKAMAKDRTQRYSSASELAADVGKHLSNEPVSARPASIMYRSRGFLRNLRAISNTSKMPTVVAAVVTLAALAAGAYLGYSSYALRMREQRLAQAEEAFYSVKVADVRLAELQQQGAKPGDIPDHVKKERILADRLAQLKEYETALNEFVYDKLDETDRLILRVTRRLGECELTAPPEYIGRVKNHVAQWRSTGRFVSSLKRAQEYGYVKRITDELLLHDLSPDFFYLVMQESDFNPAAVGPRTRYGIAKGMWQLLPDTAVRYGLKPGPLRDEARPDANDDRQDWSKATTAAVRYLKDVYSTDAQASGLLVMASYNWGEHRVIDRVREIAPRPRERNFWTLIDRFPIPSESYTYVFNIIAAAVIGENPRAFGLDFDNPLASALRQYETGRQP